MTEDSFNERLAAIARALLHEPDVLSRLSQQSNVKLRDVARNLVETGEIPRI